MVFTHRQLNLLGQKSDRVTSKVLELKVVQLRGAQMSFNNK